MKNKSALKRMLSFFLAALIPAGSFWLAAEILVPPVEPLRLSGAVSIAVRPYNTFLILSLRIRRGSDPAPGLRVALMGQPATEPTPGQYRCEISGFSPTRGSLVTVTITGAAMLRPVHPGGREEPLVATAAIGSLVEFTSPAPEAHVSRASIRPLPVSWRGGNPPYGLTIYPLGGKDESGEAVMEESGIAGNSAAVPMTKFIAMGKYGIYLSCMMEQFRYNLKVDPGSSFQLRQSRGTYITVE